LVQGTFAMPFVLAIVSSVGVISLGFASIAKIGWQGIEATPMSEIGIMFVAGSFNAMAFLALTKALQLVSLVQVNAVSASQSALAAIAGVVLFREAPTVSLMMGVLLTVLGLTLVDRGRKIHPAATPRVHSPDEEAPAAPVEEGVAIPPVQMPGAALLPRDPTSK
jgi:drug/metabolite transporter (DMT)-like permease